MDGILRKSETAHSVCGRSCRVACDEVVSCSDVSHATAAWLPRAARREEGPEQKSRTQSQNGSNSKGRSRGVRDAPIPFPPPPNQTFQSASILLGVQHVSWPGVSAASVPASSNASAAHPLTAFPPQESLHPHQVPSLRSEGHNCTGHHVRLLLASHSHRNANTFGDVRQHRTPHQRGDASEKTINTPPPQSKGGHTQAHRHATYIHTQHVTTVTDTQKGGAPREIHPVAMTITNENTCTEGREGGNTPTAWGMERKKHPTNTKKSRPAVHAHQQNSTGHPNAHAALLRGVPSTTHLPSQRQNKTKQNKKKHGALVSTCRLLGIVGLLLLQLQQTVEELYVAEFLGFVGVQQGGESVAVDCVEATSRSRGRHQGCRENEKEKRKTQQTGRKNSTGMSRAENTGQPARDGKHKGCDTNNLCACVETAALFFRVSLSLSLSVSLVWAIDIIRNSSPNKQSLTIWGREGNVRQDLAAIFSLRVATSMAVWVMQVIVWVRCWWWRQCVPWLCDKKDHFPPSSSSAGKARADSRSQVAGSNRRG